LHNNMACSCASLSSGYCGGGGASYNFEGGRGNAGDIRLFLSTIMLEYAHSRGLGVPPLFPCIFAKNMPAQLVTLAGLGE